MKINFRKFISTTLQVFGMLFILILIVKISFYFYYRYDKKLQKNTWELVSYTDSTKTPLIFKDKKYLLKFKGISKFIMTYNGCDEVQYSYEIGKYGFIDFTNNFQYNKNCSDLVGLANYNFEKVKDGLFGIYRYKIRNDSLWILTRCNSRFVFKIN